MQKKILNIYKLTAYLCNEKKNTDHIFQHNSDVQCIQSIFMTGPRLFNAISFDDSMLSCLFAKSIGCQLLPEHPIFSIDIDIYIELSILDQIRDKIHQACKEKYSFYIMNYYFWNIIFEPFAILYIIYTFVN